MTLASFFVFSIAALCGTLVVHLLWPEQKGMILLLKLSLGVGVGLGTSSILYFLTLLIAPGQLNVMAIQTGLLVSLLIVVFIRERRRNWRGLAFSPLSRLQVVMLALSIIALIISSLSYFNQIRSRPQGAFDAWSIWNRAARFIYRDPENWRATFSPELHWGAHADYPLLVPLNVAWGWEAVGMETQRIPMMQSAFFMYASVGLMFASIGLLRTLGQASLASLVLMSTPTFVTTSYGLIADVQVMYFIFASGVLMYFYFLFKHSPLLVLAGFMAGLGAWTKNEGLLFVAVSFPVLFWENRREGLRGLAWYLVGLIIPMVVVLYFKLVLAPPNDLLAGDGGGSFAKLADFSRYWIILQALTNRLSTFAGWPVNIFIQLAIYAFLVRFTSPIRSLSGTRALAAMLCLQLLGYCIVYLLTPHDLAWHLGTSLGRLILHLYPAILFLFFCTVSEPETAFPQRVNSKG